MNIRALRLYLLAMVAVPAIATALIFLIAAGLLTKSALIIGQAEPGFDPTNLLTARIALPANKYVSGEERTRFFTEVRKRIAGLPGVQSAGLATTLPFSGQEWMATVAIEGRDALPDSALPVLSLDAVSPDYFQAMRIPVRMGRSFSELDDANRAGVVVINEQTARRYWPNQDPIGRRVRLAIGQPSWRQVVGVVGDVKHRSLEDWAAPRIYMPCLQAPSRWMSLVVRSRQDPATLAEAIRQAVRSVDRDQSLTDIKTMEQRLLASMVGRSGIVRLSRILAGAALLAAMAAAFGVMVSWPSSRADAGGASRSFGARQRKIFWLLGERTMGMLFLGLCIGLGLVLFFAKPMRSLLFGVTPTDPGVLSFGFLTVAGGVFLVSYVGAWIATRRIPT
jgi:putative ABC transport system permease protein